MSDAILRMQHLHKEFDGVVVLHDINIDFIKGEVTTIIGPSGSGKSTLLRCINQLETVTSGDIFFHDANITSSHVNLNQIRSKIGMVFQSFNLFNNLTVLENCTIGPIKVLHIDKETATNTALALLERVGMLDFKDRKVTTLSGGQKQRVAIARTLAMDPEIILFDEPTSSLDPEMVNDVLEVIKSIITPHISFVVVTHEMDFAKDVSNRVIFMDHGEVIVDGTPTEIFEEHDNERLRRFINRL